MSSDTLDFNQIYQGGKAFPQGAGRLRLARPAGIGWKRLSDGFTVKFAAVEFYKMKWAKCAKGYQLRIQLRNGEVHKFDGFDEKDYDDLSRFVHQAYAKTLEHEEVSVRGWNWGEVEFMGDQLAFAVSDRVLFEVPLKDVATTSLVTKTDVSLRFQAAPTEGGETAMNLGDTLEEIRFYVPGIAVQDQVEEKDGTVTLKDKDAMDIDIEKDDKDDAKEKVKTNGTGEGDEEEEDEENYVQNEEGSYITSAAVLLETIKQKSDIGEGIGESIASFSQVLCLTPRGRFDIDFYMEFIVLRGKSRDHKVMFNAITKMFLLRHPDDIAYNLVIELNPPLRQGQTKYPYLVLQYPTSQEVELNLNIEDDLLETKFKDVLTRSYDGFTYEIMSKVLSGLATKRIIEPDLDLFKTSLEMPGFKCSYKATECMMYPMKDSILTLFKPVNEFRYKDITAITFPGPTVSDTKMKTFEITISTIAGQEFVYSNIPTEEQNHLLSFIKTRNVKVIYEKGEQKQSRLSYKEYDDSDSDGGPRRIGGEDMDEDSEEDEDFVAESSDSDVAEEYDENGSSSSSSGSDSDSSESESEDDDKKRKKSKKDQQSKKRKVSSKD